MALPNWQEVKVIKIKNETDKVRRYWLQFEDIFTFQAGQFVTFDLPISDKKNKRMRSYSISSAPDGSSVIELLIENVPDGMGTDYIFDDVSIGSSLTLRGPLGTFTLPQQLHKDLILICTGTGIAPFMSYIMHIQAQQLPHQNIYLIYGSRHEKDLLYKDELHQLSQDLPSFHYIPTLTQADEQWTGRRGRVHDIYTELCATHQPAYFFLCGLRNMIDDAKIKILELGYEKSDIHLEIYG